MPRLTPTQQKWFLAAASLALAVWVVFLLVMAWAY
jgi:hypothetical protein